MSELIERLFPRRSAAPVMAEYAATEADRPTPAQGTELRGRRARLAQEIADRQYDLGGLTYEMAIRDHFRLDVLVRHAAQLQQLDAELGEIERILHLDEQGAAGLCPTCGAPHSRGALYCWACAQSLIPVQEEPS